MNMFMDGIILTQLLRKPLFGMHEGKDILWIR